MVEIFNLKSINDIYKHIEKCGRVCYQSSDKITEDSATPFIEGILKSGHESVIEHTGLIFKIVDNNEYINNVKYLLKDIYGLSYYIENGYIYLSGNIRTFRDITKKKFVNDFNNIFNQDKRLKIFVCDIDNNINCNLFNDDIQLYQVQYADIFNNYTNNINRITVHMLTNLSCYKDITRHRLASFSIESTRFCNYSKGKYGSELSILKPVNLELNTPEYNEWLECMNNIEKHYIKMVTEYGCRADQARLCLPHSIAANVIMTATTEEWKHIFNLRCAKAAHPDVRKIMLMILELFYKEKYKCFDDIFDKYKTDIEEFKNL